MKKEDNNLLLSADKYFVSIQGEGPTLGKPSIFLRLQLCNLNCKWCDTRYTWDRKDPDFSKASLYSIDDLVEALDHLSKSVKNLVVTGGEPLLQQYDVLKLIKALYSMSGSWKFEIETNGTILPLYEFVSYPVLFNVSPKLAGSQVKEHLRYDPFTIKTLSKSFPSIFKFVISKLEDIEEVKKLVSEFDIPPDKVYLMPEATEASELMTRPHSLGMVMACTENGFNLSTRLQVLLWGNKRGV